MSEPPNTASSIWRITRLVLVLASIPARPCAAAPLSVSIAKTGFPQDQVSAIRAHWSWQSVFTPGDATLYATLHFSDFYPSAQIRRSAPAIPLESSPDAAIPRIKWHTALGDLTLAEYIAHPAPRTQAFIVLRRGKIIYETYPGMRDTDSHVLFSVGKTAISLVLALQESERKLDVHKTVGAYLPKLKDTAWSDIKVIDVLNMASGLDIRESKIDPGDYSSNFARLVHNIFNVHGKDGRVESQLAVIQSAKPAKRPGEFFEYSSVNSQVLVMLAEEIDHRPWPEIFESRVYSKLYAESDASVMLSPDHVAVPCGFISMRLRDLARFGLLFTPSWRCAARQQVVTPAMLHAFQTLPNSPLKSRAPAGDVPSRNSRQWDDISAAGDLFKSGMFGQGLYVSPSKDLVIAWFSTSDSTGILGYARAIAAK